MFGVLNSGRGCPEGRGKAHFRQRIDEPFRRIIVIPERSVAIVTWIRMVIVVIAFAKCQQRHKPRIAARIGRTVGLFSHK